MLALERPRQEDPEFEDYIVVKATLFCIALIVSPSYGKEGGKKEGGGEN